MLFKFVAHKTSGLAQTMQKLSMDVYRASTSSTPIYDVPLRATPTLAEWTPVSPDETEKLISAAVNKTCDLDPAPTWLVKEMRGLLSPFITLVFNN